MNLPAHHKEKWNSSDVDHSNDTELYVGHLPFELGDIEFRNLFVPFGKVMVFYIMRHKGTNKSKGTGVIKFKTHEQAENALKAMDGMPVKNMLITVNWSKRFEGDEISIEKPARSNKPQNPSMAARMQRRLVVDTEACEVALSKLPYDDLIHIKGELEQSFTSVITDEHLNLIEIYFQDGNPDLMSEKKKKIVEEHQKLKDEGRRVLNLQSSGYDDNSTSVEQEQADTGGYQFF